MTPARALRAAHLPPGPWTPADAWAVSSIWDVVTVRGAAKGLARHHAHQQYQQDQDHRTRPGGPVFADAAERLELTVGELAVNGLRHGEPPVQVRVSRGQGGWLVVVSDSAPHLPPEPAAATAGSPALGGMGIRLVRAMAADSGWYAEGRRKHVWAVIGDHAPRQPV